ncbi:class I SAM-dependent methyltransferase [Pseudoflavitalea sp. X16]|uniref:methyltransferase domain-containing protein n=1 Tax=Paraflavitalea devenefica TaxID=2716334 RepID=UPI00141E4378|nr:methyltransferase domain-containing protein [Paraflavitalea devenefica]NII29549.1 class I SAM-dependent methyltransferase [Paraflavitalea devenefica]
MIQRLIRKTSGRLAKSGLAESLYYGPKRNRYLTRDFILSDEYKKLMLKNAGAPSLFDRFIDDAQESTPNYQFRHSESIQKQLGSWRWKGMYQFREQIAPIIFKENAKGIDLGGAYGPVSRYGVIVDFSKQDIFGRPVQYKYLDDIDFKADFLYASHTLEHIKDLDNLAIQMKRVVKPGGDIVILVPSYSCVSWRVGNHTNRDHNDHVWTFHLLGTPIHEPINSLLAIDTVLEKYFTITLKQYTGDNSILLLAKNN